MTQIAKKNRHLGVFLKLFYVYAILMFRSIAQGINEVIQRSGDKMHHFQLVFSPKNCQGRSNPRAEPV